MGMSVSREFNEYPRSPALDWKFMQYEVSESEEHFQRLQKEETRLFSQAEEQHRMSILEWECDYFNKNPEPLSYVFTDVDSLRDYLMFTPSRGWPLVRHVFIEANNPRAHLNCSVGMLKCILAYEQVPPTFLKAVHGFGDRKGEPANGGLSSFGFQDGHSQSYREPMVNPDGEYKDRTCQWYLLRSAEKRRSVNQTGQQWPWEMRQMAIYHAFNLKSGASTFLTVQGSDRFRTQVEGDKSLLPVDASPFPGSDKCTNIVGMALRMALQAHLVYLSWSCRHWGEFIVDARTITEHLLNPARTVSIDTELEDPINRSFSSGPRHDIPGPGESLNKFNFQDLQGWTLHSGVIRNALLALRETSRVMRRIREYYKDRRTSLFESIGSEDTDKAIVCFLRELGSLAETVGVAEEQLRALASELDQGMRLHQKGYDLRIWYEHRKHQDKPRSSENKTEEDEEHLQRLQVPIRTRSEASTQATQQESCKKSKIRDLAWLGVTITIPDTRLGAPHG